MKTIKLWFLELIGESSSEKVMVRYLDGKLVSPRVLREWGLS